MKRRKIDLNIVKEYYLSGLGCKKIAELLGFSRSKVQYAVHDLGISDPGRVPKAKVSIEILIKEYKSGLGIYRLGKKYGVLQGSIRGRLKRAGVVLDISRKCLKRDGARNTRRTRIHEFKNSIKKIKFLREKGICEVCKIPVINWQSASYHHIKLVSDGGDASLDNCMLLHSECHKDKFYELHGFDFNRLNNYKKIARDKKEKINIDKELFIDLYVNKNFKIKQISIVMGINFHKLKNYLNGLVKKGAISKEFTEKKVREGNLKITDKEIIDKLEYSNQSPSIIAKELGITERTLYYRLSRLSKSGDCDSLKNYRIRFNSERRHFKELICAFCGKKFKRDIRQINTKSKKDQKNFYCNKICMGNAFKKIKELEGYVNGKQQVC